MDRIITWEQMSPTNKAVYLRAHGGNADDLRGATFRIVRVSHSVFAIRFELVQKA